MDTHKNNGWSSHFSNVHAYSRLQDKAFVFKVIGQLLHFPPIYRYFSVVLKRNNIKDEEKLTETVTTSGGVLYDLLR